MCMHAHKISIRFVTSKVKHIQYNRICMGNIAQINNDVYFHGVISPLLDGILEKLH